MTAHRSPSATRPRPPMPIGLAAFLLLAPATATGAHHEQGHDPQDPAPDVTIHQTSGKVVYWVLPGPRELGEEVFGTTEEPRMTLAPRLEEAKQMVADGKAPATVPELLEKLPILVGVPEKARQTDEQGRTWLKQPNPFSDQARIVQGEFQASYWDETAEDPPGPPGKTPDRATMEARFQDPAGNDYRVVLDHVVKPPFPGYETGGGVLLDGVHHGTTGTGSPLMPQVWTVAAFWGVGDVYVNGERTQPGRVMHMMTTEVVRDKDYELALQAELPLTPDEWHVKGQSHHTHLVVLPVKAVKGKGPMFEPLETAFELPNGKPQPFMHIMFEQDEIDR